MQDGSIQSQMSQASQDGDVLPPDFAAAEESRPGLQLPPPASGEIEVAEVRPAAVFDHRNWSEIKQPRGAG